MPRNLSDLLENVKHYLCYITLVSKVARKGELLTDYNKVKINDKLVMETPEQKPGLLLITKN